MSTGPEQRHVYSTTQWREAERHITVLEKS